MQTSEGIAGQLVSAYALGTVLVTIPAIVLTRRFRRKPLFLIGITAFLVANIAAAVSPDIAFSLTARFVAGGLSGMLWGMLAGYTVRITPPALAGRALSLVAAGAPVGIAFGTPLGAWLGVTFGWRWSFGGLAILTLVVLALAVFVVPDAPGQQASARLPLGRVIRIPGVAPILFVIFAWMLGNTTTYTYIAPFLNAAGSGVAVEITPCGLRHRLHRRYRTDRGAHRSPTPGAAAQLPRRLHHRRRHPHHRPPVTRRDLHRDRLVGADLRGSLTPAPATAQRGQR